FPSVTPTAAAPVAPVASNSFGNGVGFSQNAPLPPFPNDFSQSPGSAPRPPAAQAAKTVQKERVEELPTINVSDEKKKGVYKADPLPKSEVSTEETLPILGASPPMTIKTKQGGIRTFLENNKRLVVEDSDLTEGGTKRRDSLSCPNGLQELRYADGRPVMCLPGKNQCPEKSVCYFNGVDFFCCPNSEDPYDKHVFGGEFKLLRSP
ncbi:unnamed protein product, partial [Cylicostephanus goldi]